MLHYRRMFFFPDVRFMETMLKELEQPEDRMELVLKRDASGRTHLMHAATEGHLDVIKFLHQNNADLDAKDFAGHTALMEAALWGRWTVFRHLVQIGADIDAKDRTGR